MTHQEQGGYRGSHDSYSLGRDLLRIQTMWTKETLPTPIGSLDALIVHQLHQAQQQGKTTINIVDFGSGTGELLHSSLENLYLLPQSMQFLTANPSYTIRFLGLTDPYNDAIDVAIIQQQAEEHPRDFSTLSLAETNLHPATPREMEELDSLFTIISESYPTWPDWQQYKPQAINELRRRLLDTPPEEEDKNS